MFFEGSEKKAEIIVNNNTFSLLTDLDDGFWQALVARCNAQILSCIDNEYCKAFLLSESSLFVWNDRFLIITCGVTTLVNAIDYFLEQIDQRHIHHVTYQRKNEYFSHAQLSCFDEDTKLLAQRIKGKAYRFGEMDSHHNYIFHQDNQYLIPAEDKSYELLAYQISSPATQLLTTPGLSPQCIRDFLSIDDLLPGFLIDDFVFNPYGYSLNAISKTEYLTIHVTPQAQSSYVSFKSNINLIMLVPQILAALQPASFDLLSFNEFNFADQIQTTINKEYISKSLVSDTLTNGCFVCFANFIKPQHHYTKPVSLGLTQNSHAL